MIGTITEVIQHQPKIIISNEPPQPPATTLINLKEEEEHVNDVTLPVVINNKPNLYTYQKRVSFDNVTNIPPAYHSFTLKQSSHGFERTRRSRTFMIAIDLFEGTLDSLSFTLKSLVDEGDEIIVVGVYSPVALPNLDDNNSSTTLIQQQQQQLLSTNNNILSPREKAQQIMNWIVNSHQGDNIHMVVELTFGKPELALEEMMRMYQPSMLIVGSKIKNKYKHAYSGAGIFKYRLKHSHIPVVIVRDKGPGNSRSASTGDLIASSSTASAPCSSDILVVSSAPTTKEDLALVVNNTNTVKVTKRKKMKSFSLFNCGYFYTSSVE